MLLVLDGQGALHRKLYVALRSAILDGRLAAGVRLPSSRTLADDLGLARNTVLAALEQLTAEGYVFARRGSGTYVERQLPVDMRVAPPPTAAPSAKPTRAAPSQPRLSRAARAAMGLGRVPSWETRQQPRSIDFRYGDPSYQDLPLASWARLYSRHMRRASALELAYRAPGGDPMLRAELAAYLSRARGVRCRPEQVIVTAGSQQAIDLSLRVLVEPGDRVGIEDPHYPGFRVALRAARARIVPIPVDADAIRVDRVVKQRGLRLLCVTPSHQFPTGALLPVAKRLALLEWAAKTNAYILEDDYDGEFRYAGRPLESLQALDLNQRVLYVGTFSKIMFPALRLGYVVVPDAVVEPFLHLKAATDTGSAGVEQRVLAEFMRSGQFERHVRRNRLRNAARHAALLNALDARLGGRVRFGRAPAGLHVWLEVPGLSPQRGNSLVASARAEGLTLHTGATCHVHAPRCANFILGYASLDERQIERGVVRLARALDRLTR